MALLLLGALLMMVSAAPARAQDANASHVVTVAAGGFDRQGTVVSFALPDRLPSGEYHLADPEGQRIPLQVEANRAWFVVDRLSAGAERTYQLRTGSTASDAVERTRKGRALAFSVAGRPALQYWVEPRPLPRADIDSIYLRGGYLHPVRTPSGRVITGDYSPGHVHHHGVWAAWTNTTFRGREPDFWNMAGGTGAVVPMALDSAWAGAVQGGFQARHRYVDYSAPEPVSALYETWTLRAYNVPSSVAGFSYHLFDIDMVQSTASASPLTLPEYHYGGAAIRGLEEWYGPENTIFLTSAGKDRSDGNETRARWTYMGGDVDGQQAGIAMLSHPTNFRSPQPVRIHPEMPYFCYAPSQLGAFSIRPGEPYAARYRFVVFDGPPDPEALDRLWNDYAYPPAVTVERSPAYANQ
jgi:hypothetical protein